MDVPSNPHFDGATPPRLSIYTNNDIATGDTIVECEWVRLRIPRRVFINLPWYEVQSFFESGIRVGLQHPELVRKGYR